VELAALSLSIDPTKAKAGFDAFNAGLERIVSAAERAQQALDRVRMGKGRGRAGSPAQEAQAVFQRLPTKGLPVTRGINEATSAVERLKRSLGGVQGLLLGLGAAGLARGVVQAIGSYESLVSALVGVEGSAGRAQAKMGELQAFADKSAVPVDQVVRAYTRLKAMSLDASEETIRAFGDIAASVPGKTITDFVEAVADGVMGETERLKEFGIKLKKSGDDVSLSFGKTTVKVKNDTESIQQALIQIAKTNFGGALERQADTLQGQLTLLESKFMAAAVAIGEGGLKDALKELVQFLTETASGSNSVAKELGQDLADAVRALTGGLKFLLENLGYVKAALVGFLALRAASTVVGLAGAFQTAAAGAGVLRTALTALNLTNPLGWMAIAITLTLSLKEALGGLSVEAEAMAERMTESLRKMDKEREEARKRAAQEAGGAVLDLLFAGPAASRSGDGRSDKLKKEEAASKKAFDRQQGKKKAGGDGKGVKAEVDAVAMSLQDLRFAASEAEAALGLVMANPADARALEIETELLAWRNGLLRDGKTVTAAQEAEARALITTRVDAAAEAERLKKAEEEYAESLKRSAEEAARKRQIVADDLAGGALEVEKTRELAGLHGQSAREVAIETAFLERLYALKAQGISVDAKTAQTIHDQVTALQDLNEQMGRQAAQKQFWEDAFAPLKSLTEQNPIAEFAQVGVSALNELSSVLTDFLLTGEADFKAFAQSLKRELIEKGILLGLNLLLGSLTGGASLALTGGAGLLGAAVFHDGGTVGRGGRGRAVSPGVFAGARRYHSGGFPGLRPDEVPAILQKGERVLSRREVASGAGGGVVKNISIDNRMYVQTPDADSFRASERQMNRKRERALRQALGEA
jgi:hypothetical protein